LLSIEGEVRQKADIAYQSNHLNDGSASIDSDNSEALIKRHDTNVEASVRRHRAAPTR
jgi:hypothetical protein